MGVAALTDGQGTIGEKKEYRQWNPFRSKLGAAVIVGVVIRLTSIGRYP